MNKLHKELKEIFDDYTDDVIKATNETIDEISKETVKNLKSSGSFKDYRPKYRKSWRVSNGDKKLNSIQNYS